MANIGTFTKTEQGFVGEIVTLSFQARNVRLGSEASTNDNAPSHRVYVGRAEIGAAWANASTKTATTFRSSSTTRASTLRSTRTSSRTKAANATRSSGPAAAEAKTPTSRFPTPRPVRRAGFCASARAPAITPSPDKPMIARKARMITVIGSANKPRPPKARRVMRFKRAKVMAEIVAEAKAEQAGASDDDVQAEAGRRAAAFEEKGLLLGQWNLDDIGADLQRCGLAGSPTKVFRVQSIVLTKEGYTEVPATEDGIRQMIHELVIDRTLG